MILLKKVKLLIIRKLHQLKVNDSYDDKGVNTFIYPFCLSERKIVSQVYGKWRGT